MYSLKCLASPEFHPGAAGRWTWAKQINSGKSWQTCAQVKVVKRSAQVNPGKAVKASRYTCYWTLNKFPLNLPHSIYMFTNKYTWLHLGTASKWTWAKWINPGKPNESVCESSEQARCKSKRWWSRRNSKAKLHTPTQEYGSRHGDCKFIHDGQFLFHHTLLQSSHGEVLISFHHRTFFDSHSNMWVYAVISVWPFGYLAVSENLTLDFSRRLWYWAQ